MSICLKTLFQRHAIIILALSFVFSCSSCDSISRTGSVKATALFSGKELELPISNTANWGDYAAREGLTFKSGKPLKKLSTELLDQGASLFSADAYSLEVILFHNLNDSGTADDYCIRLLDTDGINSTYVFSGLKAEVTTDQTAIFSMLIPIHLFSDKRINQSIVAEINLGAEYETLAYWGDDLEIQNILDLFYSFYKECGWYDLEKGDDYFIIKGYKPGLAVRSDEGLELPSPVKVKFVKHVNLVYFIIDRA